MTRLLLADGSRDHNCSSILGICASARLQPGRGPGNVSARSCTSRRASASTRSVVCALVAGKVNQFGGNDPRFTGRPRQLFRLDPGLSNDGAPLLRLRCKQKSEFCRGRRRDRGADRCIPLHDRWMLQSGGCVGMNFHDDVIGCFGLHEQTPPRRYFISGHCFLPRATRRAALQRRLPDAETDGGEVS